MGKGRSRPRADLFCVDEDGIGISSRRRRCCRSSRAVGSLFARVAALLCLVGPLPYDIYSPTSQPGQAISRSPRSFEETRGFAQKLLSLSENSPRTSQKVPEFMAKRGVFRQNPAFQGKLRSFCWVAGSFSKNPRLSVAQPDAALAASKQALSHSF